MLPAAWRCVLPVLLALVACQRGAPDPRAALGPSTERGQAYQCGEIRVEARLDGRNVVLVLPDRVLTLPPALSASGARFADAGGNELWSKGRESALLTLDGGPRIDCRPAATGSPWAVARERGVGCRAVGHPRARLPLTLHAAPTGDAGLDAAVGQAVRDWNTLAREILGVEVFAPVEREAEAQVRVAFGSAHASGLMGHAQVAARNGVIELPVRVEVFAPERRGATTRETLLYQIVAHELGHALGLVHVADPASIMCCETGRVDLDDPATRRAYVHARRYPDVRSARAQLAEHYARLWRADR